MQLHQVPCSIDHCGLNAALFGHQKLENTIFWAGELLGAVRIWLLLTIGSNEHLGVG